MKPWSPTSCGRKKQQQQLQQEQVYYHLVRLDTGGGKRQEQEQQVYYCFSSDYESDFLDKSSSKCEKATTTSSDLKKMGASATRVAVYYFHLV
eukprot:scaffold31479_cov73-Skeletonema_marinoi.AAC.1